MKSLVFAWRQALPLLPFVSTTGLTCTRCVFGMPESALTDVKKYAQQVVQSGIKDNLERDNVDASSSTTGSVRAYLR